MRVSYWIPSWERRFLKVFNLIVSSAAESRSNYTGLVIVASLSVILVGAVLYIAHRENTKRRRSSMPNQSS